MLEIVLILYSNSKRSMKNVTQNNGIYKAKKHVKHLKYVKNAKHLKNVKNVHGIQ